MIALDASVPIAHLHPQDSHHRAASEFLDSVAGQRLVIHSLNLAEVLVGGAMVHRAAEMLRDLETIGIQVADRQDGDRQDGEPLRLANLRAVTGLKLPDCCALDTALITGSTLATFDAALARVARHHHVPVAPGEGVA